MPPREPPDQRHMNGTKNKAIRERVEAPNSKPCGVWWNQVPSGGRPRSSGSVLLSSSSSYCSPRTISENVKVELQLRQRTRSLPTFTSASGILPWHFGQLRSRSALIKATDKHRLCRVRVGV